MLNKSELSSLDFAVRCLFIKLFKTNNIELVAFCHDQFGLDKPSVLWVRRVRKFDSKFVTSQNAFNNKNNIVLHFLMQNLLFNIT